MDTSKKKETDVTSTDIKEIKDMLTQLTERIKKLENVNEFQPDEADRQQRPWIDRNSRRGYEDRHRGNARGSRARGQYQSSRPLAGRTFAPVCFKCNRRGHYQAHCPN